MPGQPSLAQRVRWHVAHARACACRPMPKSVVAALRDEAPSPAVIVQRVEILWTKKTRSPPGAARRRATPRVFALDSARAPFVMERHRFRETARGAFAEGAVERATSETCPEHEGALVLQTEGDVLVLGLRWDDRAGKPSRHPKTSAIRIRRGQTARLVINGRHAGYDDHWYTQETFNVAYGEDIDDDVFLKRRPDRTFSIEADLW
jgi:hypothetical protein